MRAISGLCERRIWGLQIVGRLIDGSLKIGSDGTRTLEAQSHVSATG